MSIAEIEGLRAGVGLADVKGQLRDHVYRRSRAAFAAGDRDRDSIRDAAALRGRQRDVRARFIEALGGLPSSGAPLEARVTGVVRETALTIEKIIYQSRPGVFVTANLYLPKGLASPAPAVLFLCGHYAEARLAPEYQTVCRHLARDGLVVLAQDPVGQGERWSYWEPGLGRCTVPCGTHEHDYAGTQSLLLGEAIARYFVHDAMRSIDYLLTRPEVDPARIGVTGNSGGGTQTSLVMLCEPRVAAAAPATFIMNRETYMDMGQAQDAEQIWPGFTAMGFDHEDVLMMMAPRPVLVLAVKSDFFPIEGTRRTVERCRRFWDLCGAPSGLEYHEEDIEHHYSPSMAAHAARFFAERLGAAHAGLDGGAGRSGEAAGAGGASRALPVSTDPIEQRLLWCTATGQARGELRGARGVHEQNLARLEECAAERARLPDAEAKKRAAAWLRERVDHDRRPCPPNVRMLKEWLGGLENGLLYHLVMWRSQEDAWGGGALFRSHDRAGERLPLTIGLWRDGTGDLGRHLEWIHASCAEGRAVLVPDLPGMGMFEPHAVNPNPMLGNYGTMFKLCDDLIWLDDSLPALRTWELLRSVEICRTSIPELDAERPRLRAWGRYGMYAELAAFLDPRLADLSVTDGMESLAAVVSARHYDETDVKAVVMPGFLRRLDLPDLRRWRGSAEA
jgi:hypothetical protein